MVSCGGQHSHKPVDTLTQCDQIGQFWKFLVTNFLSNIAQMFGDVLGNLENHHFLSQAAVTYFWATFEKNWASFLPTSSHTALTPRLGTPHAQG